MLLADSSASSIVFSSSNSSSPSQPDRPHCAVPLMVEVGVGVSPVADTDKVAVLLPPVVPVGEKRTVTTHELPGASEG